MSYGDVEQRPAKKRRFFVEDSPVADKTLEAEASLPDEINALAETYPDLRPKESFEGRNDTNSSSRCQARRPDEREGFDIDAFKSVVGEEATPDTIERLKGIAGNNLEKAINAYFDGSWKGTTSGPQPGSPTVLASTRNEMQAEPTLDKTVHPATSLPVLERPRSPPHRSMANKRYVGAFGVVGWATQSGSNLIKHNEKVNIERARQRPTVMKAGKSGKVKVIENSRTSKRQDIVVRFTNSRGQEVGRLERDSAAWVSTLLDQKICAFEGICVYVPDVVRTNETIFLQLRCYLLRTAFEAGSFVKPAETNRQTGIFEAKETKEERDLRNRQVALVKLFDEINLHPSKVNETTEKHRKQGLLQAAEMAEQYEQNKGSRDPKNQEDGASSPPSEDAEEGQELEQDQLDSLYKKAQSFDFGMPEAQPANTFTLTLRKYQKQALHWMIGKEKGEQSEQREVSMHPLWEEYRWPTKDVDSRLLPELTGQDCFYVNPYSGELSLDFPVQEQNCLGGILADEMGLGKTIEMLSLIHSHQSDVAMQLSNTAVLSVNNLPRLPKDSSAIERAPCTTLVVAPMSLLAQWQSEAEKASATGTLKVLVYYGSEKTANLQNLCCEANAAGAPNVIITSYGVVLSEFNQVAASGGNRGSHGGLFSLNYFRIILDEAHHIKNRQSKTAKACYELNAEHRWVLTGTPIVNRLEDLFSLVRFLRVEPWSNFSFWKTFITVPFESKDFIRALDVVQTVLEPLVLRRTKDMKTPDGEALVPLPPRIIDIEKVELSKPERDVYDHIFTRAKRTFTANVEAGTVLKSYTTIFAQILRLRQSCCHPILTRNKDIVADEEEAAAAADAANGLADDMDLQVLIDRFTADEGDQDANKYGAHVLQQIQDEADNECPICSEEPMVDQAVTGCWHSACKHCLLSYIEHQKEAGELPRCFNCREPINARDVFEVIKHDDADDTDEQHSAANPRITLHRTASSSHSAKIAALLTHLTHLRRASPATKSVIFSQFTSFLTLIEPALRATRIPFLRFDGSLTQRARAAVLADFAQASKPGLVLLLSLRAGGVGLNLTAAQRVFVMDPWWSWAVEAQAVDRVHRMGQEGEVRVVRFVCEGSIEEKMLRIQERKKFIASSLGMMSDDEKKMQRIEDIKELLS